MPYTPTPLVNFQYEPEKSDVRRLLDTQAKIKKEKQADQSFEMEMKQAQQAYDMGVMKIKEAQMQTDELLKEKELDKLASQTYNSVMIAGGSRGDALREVQNVFRREGGWARGEKAREDASAAWKQAWENAEVSPAHAQAAADLANSLAPEGTPPMTGQTIMEAKKRMRAAEMKPIELEDGDVLMFDQQGNPYVQNFSSTETRERKKLEMQLKGRELDVRAQGQQLDYAASMASTAESAAGRKQRAMERAQDISSLDKQNLQKQESMVNRFDREIKQATKAQASGNKDSILGAIATIAASRGQTVPIMPTDEANKEILKQLVEESKVQRDAAIRVMKSMPGGESRAMQLEQTYGLSDTTTPDLAAPATGESAKGKEVKPNVAKDFMAGKKGK